MTKLVLPDLSNLLKRAYAARRVKVSMSNLKKEKKNWGVLAAKKLLNNFVYIPSG